MFYISLGLTGTQMNRMYSVTKGRIPGLYKTWEECKAQVDKFPGAVFKKVTQANASSDSENPHIIDDIVCFSDGSCIHNGNIKARAGYACVFPNHPTFTTHRKLEGTVMTNNRAEFSALLLAFEIADRIDVTGEKIMHFYTDSKLLINTVEKWIPSWKRRGWVKSDGEPILNLDLIKTINQATRKVLLHHVPAHTGGTDWFSIHNDEADRLAKIASKE